MSVFKGSAYAPALAALHRLCFHQPWTQDNFQKILSLPTTFGLGDENGFMLYADLGNAFEILTLAIHPNHRRKGLASSLLQNLQQIAQQQNKENIFLEVNVNNTAAIQLYLKNGFVQTGRRKNYYHEHGKTVDALCLTWENPR